MAEPTYQELLKRIAELEANQKKGASVGMKISAKGGLSVYGLGRFPVTLYRSQWEALLAKSADIKAFMDAHANELASKTAAQAAAE